MASLPSLSMAKPLTSLPNSMTSFSPLPLQRNAPMGQNPSARSVQVQASFKEKAVTGLTATALTASMMVPEVAEAAELTPSLNNFLLSIAAGGAVLGAILGAIIAVSNFDPVKRV